MNKITSQEYAERKAELQAMRPAKNFSIWEYVQSTTAHQKQIRAQYWPTENERAGKSNSPLEKAEQYLPTLQVIRDAVGCPVHISSGYRCPELNKLVGGAQYSDHMALGDTIAFDLQTFRKGVPGFDTPNQVLFNNIIELTKDGKIPLFKQIIHEYGTPIEPSWVHISFSKSNPKKQVLSIKPNIFQGYRDVTLEYFNDDQYLDAAYVNVVGTVRSKDLLVVDIDGVSKDILYLKNQKLEILGTHEIGGVLYYKIKPIKSK